MDNINILVNSSQTFIHGEYYPHNILVKNNIIYPIDWESAAIGPGEIDLASLIEDWKEPAAQNAIEAYKVARWEDEKNIPENFDHILLLSQLYFQFRWMAEEFSEAWLREGQQFDLLYQLAKKVDCV